MRWLLLAGAVGLLAASCGGSDAADTTTTASTASTTTSTTLPADVLAAGELVDETVSLIREFGRQWDNGTAGDALIAQDRAADSCDELSAAVETLPGWDPDEMTTLGRIQAGCLSLGIAGLALSRGDYIPNNTDEYADNLEANWSIYVRSKEATQ